MSDSQYAYRLSIIGSEDMMRMYKETKGQTELNKLWNTETPFLIRRRSFPMIPKYLKMSREHLKIMCQEDPITHEQCFYAEDLSSNHTTLNGNPMEPHQSYKLKDGDQLGFIWRKTADGSPELLFGLQFNLYDDRMIPPNFASAYSPNDARIKPKTRSNEEVETKETTKRNRDTVEATPEPKKSRSTAPIPPKVEHHEDEQVKKTPKAVGGAKSWSQEEEEKLIEVITQSDGKMTWKDIALYFPHRSPDAVRNKFKKMSDHSNNATLKSLGAKISSAKATQQQHSPVKKESTDHSSPSANASNPGDEDRRRKLWTKEEDVKLKALVLQINPQKQEDWEMIANQLGRTVKSVKHKFNDYNLRALLEPEEEEEEE